MVYIDVIDMVDGGIGAPGAASFTSSGQAWRRMGKMCSFTHKIARVFRHSVSFAGSFSTSAQRFYRVGRISHLSFTAFLLAPFIAKNFFFNFYYTVDALVHQTGKASRYFLNWLCDLSSSLKVSAGTLSALKLVTSLSKQAVKVIPVLHGVGVGLSLFVVARHIRNWYKRKNVCELSKEEQAKLYGVDQENLREKLTLKLDGPGTLELNDRIRTLRSLDILRAVVAAVSAVALIILLACPPLLPFALAVLVTATLVDLSADFYEIHHTSRFEEWLLQGG